MCEGLKSCDRVSHKSQKQSFQRPFRCLGVFLFQIFVTKSCWETLGWSRKVFLKNNHEAISCIFHCVTVSYHMWHVTVSYHRASWRNGRIGICTIIFCPKQKQSRLISFDQKYLVVATFLVPSLRFFSYCHLGVNKHPTHLNPILKWPITNHHSVMMKTMIGNHRSVVSSFPLTMLLVKRKRLMKIWERAMSQARSRLSLFVLITSQMWSLTGHKNHHFPITSGMKNNPREDFEESGDFHPFSKYWPNHKPRKSGLARKVRENGSDFRKGGSREGENYHKSVLSLPPLLPPHPLVSPALLAFLKYKMLFWGSRKIYICTWRDPLVCWVMPA